MVFTYLIFVTLFAIVSVSVAIFVVLAVNIARPLTWAATVLNAGRCEVYRRTFNRTRFSQADHLAAGRMCKAEPDEADALKLADDVTLDALYVMGEGGDQVELRCQLSEVRELASKRALQWQLHLVANMSNFVAASYVWVCAGMLNQLRFAFTGARWLWSRFTTAFQREWKKREVNYYIMGLVSACLIAGVRFWFLSGDQAGDPLYLFLDIAGVFTILPAVASVLALYRSFFALRRPKRAELKPESIRALCLAVSFVVVVFILWYSGLLVRWLQFVNDSVVHIASGYLAGRIAGVVLIDGMCLLALWRAFRWLRLSELLLSERVKALMAVWALLLLLVTCTLVPFGISWLNVPIVPVLVGGPLLGFAFVAAIFWYLEWWHKRSLLVRAHWFVERRGFRPWLPVSWLVVYILMCVLEDVLAARRNLLSSGANVCFVLNAIGDLVWVILTFAFFPIVVVTGLYVRRVAREFARLELSKAPQNPALEADD